MAFSSLYGNVILGDPVAPGGLYGFSSFREEIYNKPMSPNDMKPGQGADGDAIVEDDVLDVYNMDEELDGTQRVADTHHPARDINGVVSRDTAPPAGPPDAVDDTADPADALDSAYAFFDATDDGSSAPRGQNGVPAGAGAARSRGTEGSGPTTETGTSAQVPRVPHMYPQSQAQQRPSNVANGFRPNGLTGGVPMMNHNYMLNRGGAYGTNSAGHGSTHIMGPRTMAGPQSISQPHVNGHAGQGATQGAQKRSSNVDNTSHAVSRAAPPGTQPTSTMAVNRSAPGSASRSASRHPQFGRPLQPFMGPYMMSGPPCMPYGNHPPAPRASAARDRRVAAQQSRGTMCFAPGQPNNRSGPPAAVNPAPSQHSGNGWRGAPQSRQGSAKASAHGQFGSQHSFSCGSYPSRGGNSFYNNAGYGNNGSAAAQGHPSVGPANGSHSRTASQGEAGGDPVYSPVAMNTGSGYAGMMPDAVFMSLSQRYQRAPLSGTRGSQCGSFEGSMHSSMYSNGQTDADTMSATGIARRRQFQVKALCPIALSTPMTFGDG